MFLVAAKADVQSCISVKIWQDRHLETASINNTGKIQIPVLAGDIKDGFSGFIRNYLISLFTVRLHQTVEHGATIGKNIETHLQQLPFSKVLRSEVCIRLYDIHDSPVKPSEGELDIKARILIIPSLFEINFVYLM